MLVHLSEEEFALLLAGKEDEMAAGHLAICSECEHELDNWKADLRQIRDDTRGIVLDPSKTKRAHQVQEDQTLKALLEFGPERAIRKLLSALAY